MCACVRSACVSVRACVSVCVRACVSVCVCVCVCDCVSVYLCVFGLLHCFTIMLLSYSHTPTDKFSKRYQINFCYVVPLSVCLRNTVS